MWEVAAVDLENILLRDGVGPRGRPPSTVMQQCPSPHQEKHVFYNFDYCLDKAEGQRAVEQLPYQNLG